MNPLTDEEKQFSDDFKILKKHFGIKGVSNVKREFTSIHVMEAMGLAREDERKKLTQPEQVSGEPNKPDPEKIAMFERIAIAKNEDKIVSEFIAGCEKYNKRLSTICAEIHINEAVAILQNAIQTALNGKIDKR